MNYAVTDAFEFDMRAELRILYELNETIDQVASDARDCDTIAPKLKGALDLAWYIAEEAQRQYGGGSCGHGSCGHVEVITTPYCCTCAHFADLRVRLRALISLL